MRRKGDLGLQVSGEERACVLPHSGGKDMSCVRLDKGTELISGTGLLIGLSEGFDALTCLLDRATAILCAQVQMECSGCDQGGDIRGVTVGVDAWDEIREAMEELGPVNTRVGWETAVTHQGTQTGFEGPDQPSMGGAHRMAIAPHALGVYFGTGHEVIHGAAHIQNIFPCHALSCDYVAKELEPLVVTTFEFPLGILTIFKAKGVGA